MKSKNVLAILLSACVGLTTFASAGCGSSRETAGNRLELIVYNYNGGIGTKWLDAAKIRFEEANKNRKFDSGKEGVFIEIVPDSYNIAIDDRLNDRAASVFFLEGVDFNEHARRGRFLQIDDVVKGENPYETDKTVESKLSENTKAALSGLDGHYYAVPHYQAYSCVL